MTSSVGSIPDLPLDVYRYMGFNFLPFRELVILSLSCRAIWHRYAEIFDSIAQNERARMGLPALTDNVLTEGTIANRWRQLSPPESSDIRTDLLSRPLEYYYRLELPLVLLSDEFIDARTNNNALITLINREKDLKKALILANSITCKYLRPRSLRDLAKRAPPEIALEIASSIPNAHVKSTALAELALREGQPLEATLKIARKIPNLDVKSETLSKLALKKGVPLKSALEIAREIPLSYVKSRTLSALSLTENLSRENSLEIVRNISNPSVKIQTISKLEKKDRH